MSLSHNKWWMLSAEASSHVTPTTIATSRLSISLARLSMIRASLWFWIERNCEKLSGKGLDHTSTWSSFMLMHKCSSNDVTCRFLIYGNAHFALIATHHLSFDYLSKRGLELIRTANCQCWSLPDLSHQRLNNAWYVSCAWDLTLQQ